MRRGAGCARMSDDVRDDGSRCARFLLVRFRHVARFAQESPREINVDETEARRSEAWSAAAELEGGTADCRADRNADVGRRGKPAERLRATVGLDGIGDVRLNHADGAAARALHDSRQQQQPDGIRECKNDVRNARRRQTHEQGGASSISIGESSPERRAHQLRRGERAHQNRDDRARRHPSPARRRA